MEKSLWSEIATVKETDDEYLLSLALPDMRREELKVEVDGNVLIVTGEKNEERTLFRDGRQTYETFRGSFERKFRLPGSTATEKARADYKNGVLKISIPKSEEGKAESRRIEIGKAA